MEYVGDGEVFQRNSYGGMNLNIQTLNERIEDIYMYAERKCLRIWEKGKMLMSRGWKLKTFKKWVELN